MSKRPIAAFSALVKKTVFAPPLLARLQTDGSFRYTDRISRTASLLKTDETYKSVKTYFEHINSYESEWCSVRDGIIMTQENDVDSIQIENDNLSVMNSLIQKRIPRQEYAAVYYQEIMSLAKNMEWVELRWIPRRLNKADRLFHL
jgi:ribonuclease HI